jgi:hypothetical protein
MKKGVIRGSTDLCRAGRLGAAILFLFGAWPPQLLLACQICLPVPTTSTVERLFDAELVVLAQEDSQNPSSLRTLEVLKGEPAVHEIDLFLDNPSLRTLALNSQRKIICAYHADASVGRWMRVGTADGVFGPLVREILERAPEWQANPKKRLDFFANYLGHNNAQARNLAHLEFARAPYEEIKRYAGVLPAEELRTSLKNFRLYQWHALYILLLAQSGEEQDRDLIVGKVHAAEKTATPLQLAAWSTAWVEIEEESALDFLETRYLGHPGRTIEELQAVVLALSVHGANSPSSLRDRIVDGYRMVLANYPQLALRIVTDLVEWNQWGLAPAVAPIVGAPPPELDRAALLQLRAYLREAEIRGSHDVPPVAGSSANTLIIVLGLLALVLIAVGLGVSKRRAPQKSAN